MGAFGFVSALLPTAPDPGAETRKGLESSLSGTTSGMGHGPIAARCHSGRSQCDSNHRPSAALCIHWPTTMHSREITGSPETDPDMPPLKRVRHAPGPVGSDRSAAYVPWTEDGKTYHLPLQVRNYIDKACHENLAGLKRLFDEDSSIFKWFTEYLKLKHAVRIVHWCETENCSGTRSLQVKIEELYGRQRKSFFGLRPKGQTPTYARAKPEKRRCRYDREYWTFCQTLEFALNGGASYNWTIRFWEKDFQN